MSYDRNNETCKDIINGMRVFVARQYALDVKNGNSNSLLKSMYDLILSYAERFEAALEREVLKQERRIDA